MILDYAQLKVIWWVFICVLFLLFALLGGRDFGVSMLLPILGKNDNQRRIMINSIGPTWEGNQVWFVTAGGALFAAWPFVYAAAFSGLYLALFLVLLALILRPPGIDYRSKLPNPMWRSFWDWALFLSGFVPSLVFGVAVGNLLLGLPFYFDETLRSHYTGTFLQLLTPYTILFGLVGVSLMMMQGAYFLAHKTTGDLAQRAAHWSWRLTVLFILLYIGGGYWTILTTSGYQIETIGNINNLLIPTHKEVLLSANGWLTNYQQIPQLWGIVLLTLVSALFSLFTSLLKWRAIAMLSSSLTIIGTLATLAATLFPFVLPSSHTPNHSLTLWDATSSYLTLTWMFWATVFFLPIVLTYTAWAYRVMRGKLREEEILKLPESY